MSCEPDDIPRPAGLEQAGPSPPFGALTSLLEYFQSHLRSKGKKPADKGKMLGEFFDVSAQAVRSATSVRSELTSAAFRQYWRTHVGKDLYPVVRLLLPDVSSPSRLSALVLGLTRSRQRLPQRDNRRRNYSLKEQKLAKALIKALDLPPGSKDAMRLTSWKVPTTEDVRLSLPSLHPLADLILRPIARSWRVLVGPLAFPDAQLGIR